MSDELQTIGFSFGMFIVLFSLLVGIYLVQLIYWMKIFKLEVGDWICNYRGLLFVPVLAQAMIAYWIFKQYRFFDKCEWVAFGSVIGATFLTGVPVLNVLCVIILAAVGIFQWAVCFKFGMSIGKFIVCLILPFTLPIFLEELVRNTKLANEMSYTGGAH